MKIPFAFWGQGESDIPIVAGVKVIDIGLNEVELEYTMIDSGKNDIKTLACLIQASKKIMKLREP